ncbi:MAG: DUF4834 family protein [Flavobacteriales bacterium]|jgi:uncharacterized membrane-anchored protein YitT (DUF2179 family)
MIIEEASVSGLLRTLFYFFLGYMIIKLIARLALPYVISKGEEAMRQRAAQFYENQHKQSAEQRREGEVRVEQKQSAQSKYKDEGDYVDFVEIKND